jgi:CBS domain-containing protein
MKARSVKGLMTKNPACCTADAKLQEVAQLMAEHDCGVVPIVASEGDRKPIGIVTDRDITCRTVALGKNPLEMTAGECMTHSCVTVLPETSAEECCEIMQQHQLRRIPVVDDEGRCCGIVSLADVVRSAPKDQTVEVVRSVSQPG